VLHPGVKLPKNRSPSPQRAYLRSAVVVGGTTAPAPVRGRLGGGGGGLPPFGLWTAEQHSATQQLSAAWFVISCLPLGSWLVISCSGRRTEDGGRRRRPCKAQAQARRPTAHGPPATWCHGNRRFAIQGCYPAPLAAYPSPSGVRRGGLATLVTWDCLGGAGHGP
jgi:hypothetical protein